MHYCSLLLEFGMQISWGYPGPKPMFCVPAQFGQVNNVIIPRPTAPGTPAPPGLGKVIVEFADETGCTAAYRVLNGRRFGGRTVVATYLLEQSYMAGQLDV